MELEPVSLLKKLVRIDTTNPPGNEKHFLDVLREILEQNEIECVFQETAPGRGNLLAWLPAEDGRWADAPECGQPPLVLLSHVDVVGAQPEQWMFPPFEAREEDGYIYGRGTVDTKQLTVMELSAFLDLKASGMVRKRDVYFLATSDEESGSAWGLSWFLEHEITLGGRTFPGKELFRGSDVISEGGGFPILAGGREYYLCESGQKGCGIVEFTVQARKAKGVFFGSGDGMERAMALVQDIGNRTLAGRTLDTVKVFESSLAGAKLSPMMKKILTAMKTNSMTVTMIEGKNVNEVRVICDVRLLPGFGREYLEKELDELSGKWDCSWKILSLGEGYESSPEGGFLKLLEEATLEALQKTKEEAQILPFVSMGSSDGHFLAGLGARVYGYSPVHAWDMTFDTAVSMVHGVNERIHRDSVLLGCRVLTLAVRRAAGEERQK